MNASAPRRTNRAEESRADSVKTPWFMSRVVNRRLMLFGIVLNLAGLLALALMVVLNPNRTLSASSSVPANPDLVAETTAPLPPKVSPPPAPPITNLTPSSGQRPVDPSVKPLEKPLTKPPTNQSEQPAATSPVTPPVAAKPVPSPTAVPPAPTVKPDSSTTSAVPAQPVPAQAIPTQTKPVQAAPAPQPVQAQPVKPNPAAPAGQAVASVPKAPPAKARPTPSASSTQPQSTPPTAPVAIAAPSVAQAATPKLKIDTLHNQDAPPPTATGLQLQTAASTDGWSQTCGLIVDAQTLEPRMKPSSSPVILGPNGEPVWPSAQLLRDADKLENDGIALFATSINEALGLLGSTRQAVTVDAIVNAADNSGAYASDTVFVSAEAAVTIRSLDPRCRVVIVH